MRLMRRRISSDSTGAQRQPHSRPTGSSRHARAIGPGTTPEARRGRPHERGALGGTPLAMRSASMIRARTPVKITDERAAVRRAPRQERSRQTVEAVLDAVERVLKSDGVEGVTTNRIADAAGVSIGSVYQYFPDKQSIFTALHQRHVDEVSQVIERAVAGNAADSIEDFTCALVSSLMDAHDADPRLHEIISDVVPESSLGFRRALQATFDRVISARERAPRAEQLLLVLPHLVEALVHGGIARRPLTVSLDERKREAARAIRAYLNAGRD